MKILLGVNMRCSYPLSRYIDGQRVYYPCGRCEACLKNRRSEKALRAYLESLSHKDNCFLTVTYCDDKLPLNFLRTPTLMRSDLDGLVKRVRSLYPEKDIRYLASGEYSSKGRPHYHICFFGLSIEDFVNHTNHYHNTSNGVVLEDFVSWKKGGCLVAPFDVKTAFYVAKYLVKSGKSKDDYAKINIEPEFISQSRRPALGKRYAMLNKNRLLKDGFIRCKGQKFKIPRYFVDSILNDGSDEYQDFKERLNSKAIDSNNRYINSLKSQFEGSGKHIYQQIKEEADFREKCLKKGK